MPDQYTLESLFELAVSLDNEADRNAFLAASCGEDLALRNDLVDLLTAHGQIGAFMEAPAVALDSFAGASIIGEKPGSLIGPYKLLEQIGEGGMGLVFLAEQSAPLSRRIALKIIKPGLDTRAVVARFSAEQQALALMEHPNIARVHDAGATDSGRPYFVMELVRGAPITDFCRDNQIPLRERLELFLVVCHAVQHAHQKGIIHRDLKPTNILVANSDTTPVPKVIDFGIAKATSLPLATGTLFTGLSHILGTPLYMSPEQADPGNQDIDTRSDVYSLGVVLYELLTGATPFDAERLRSVGPEELRRIIREEEPPKPSTRATTANLALSTLVGGPQIRQTVDGLALKGDLDWIVMKSLEKDRRRRYDSPNALGDDIRRYLSNEVVEARRPSHRYVLQKFARRHRATLTGLAAIAVILIGASVVGVWLAVRATQAEGLANARLLEVTKESNEKEVALTRAVAGEEAAQRARKSAETARDAVEAARKAAVWSLYSSRMVQASIAWKDSDYATLRSLTGSSKEVDGGPDFRGWEWYFLDHQLQNAFAALPPGSVLSAAWHPRRSELAVLVPRPGHRAAIEIWAPGRPEPIKTLAPIPNDRDSPQFVHLAERLLWSGDGARLAYACQASFEERGPGTGWIVVVDVDSGRELFRRQAFDGDDWNIKHVTGFAISRSGDAIAAGNFKGQVKLWNVDSGTLRSVLHDPQEDSNHTWLEFSPDAQRLAGAFRTGRRVVWNLESGESFDFQPIGDGSAGVARWSPDGTLLAASDNTGVAIYVPNERAPRATLAHGGVLAICWLDNQTLMSGGRDKVIRSWSVNDAAQTGSVRTAEGLVTSLNVNHDASLLLTNGRSERSAEILSLDRATPFRDVIKAKRDAVGSDHLVRWSRDGRRLASAWLIMTDDILFFTDARVVDRKTKQDVITRKLGVVRWLEWTPDNAAMLAFTHHGKFHEIAVRGPSRERMEELVRYEDSFGASDCALDGTKFVHSDGKVAVIRDVATLAVLQRLPVGEDVRTVQWAPDGRRIFFGSFNSWCFADVKSVELTRVPRSGNLATQIHSVAWSPDSKRLAAGVGDGTIELWETDPPRLVTRTAGHQREPTGLAWSGDGCRLASAAEDGTVRIWDAATGDPVAVFHLPPGIGAFSVDWSPNCRELAVGATNGDIYFFDAGPSFPGPDLQPVSPPLGVNLDEK